MKSRILLGVVLSAQLSSACWFDEPLKHDFGTTPEQLADGWQVSTPESVGLRQEDLERIHHTLLREDKFVGSLGFIVVKDNKLVWEAYYRNPADRDHYHHVQSVTKVFTSMVFGAARDRGYFDNLDTTLGEIFPEKMTHFSSAKSKISIEHLLTMSSGIDFDNVDFNIELYTFHHDDPLGYILHKPMYAAPGEEFRYRNADPQIMSYIVHKTTEFNLASLAEAWLFGPLEIEDYYWQPGPDDGVTIAGNGLHLRPRDLAKVGQMLVDRGRWQGQQILSDDWIRSMTSAHAESDAESPEGEPLPYGYYWYLIPFGAAAWGNGGQYLLLQPQCRLVLVHFALPDTVGLDGSKLAEFLKLVEPLLCAEPS